MSTGVPLSAAWDDGRTQSDMPRGARPGRRGRGSSRRAASFRNNNALHHLQLQVQREIEQGGTIRQRFDSLRTSTQREMWGADQAPGTRELINNNNDYEMDHENGGITAV